MDVDPSIRAATRTVAEQIVAELLGQFGLPIILGESAAELPEDYIAVVAEAIAPTPALALSVDLAITANLPQTAAALKLINEIETALALATPHRLDRSAARLFGTPAGTVQGWEWGGRDDDVAAEERVIAAMSATITLPPCSLLSSPPWVLPKGGMRAGSEAGAALENVQNATKS